MALCEKKYKILSHQENNFLLYGLIVLILCISSQTHARDELSMGLDELITMELHELANIEVSLVSRIGEKQFQAPAAIYVLTKMDIRRSGLRRLPEILRLVPGLHVAKLDANKWAVSSRNSLSRFTSTMLVMIDGRHVYSPFYAGVYWESQDTFIEDIERIEVVRGPGGPLWGANAVDGIINIITKKAKDTLGTKAYALVGKGEMKHEVGVRHGAKTKDGVNYRFFAKSYQSDKGEYLDANISTNTGLMPIGADANDEGTAQQAGFRADWNSGRDNYMFQGNVYQGDFDEDRVVAGVRVPNKIMSEGQNLVFNWQRSLAKSNSLSINVFYDQITRDDMILHNDEKTFDLDLQHTMLISNHNLIWGLGYRYYENQADITDPSSCGFATPCFAVDPATKDLSTWSAFIQDRIAFSDTFSLIVGSKFEDNEYTGFEYQPTLRGLWRPNEDTTYWAAVTRAIRVPDRVNTDGILDFGVSTVSIGDKNKESFINYTYELGYRKRISNTMLLDGTVFYSNYHNTVQGMSASGLDDVYGLEGYLKYQYSPSIRLELGYAFHEGHTALASGGDRPLSRLPKHTLNLRAYYDLANDKELDILIYLVDESKSIVGTRDIPSYSRVDLRYAWPATKRLDMSILLSNMLDDTHAESADSTKINTGTNRGVMLKLIYTYE